MWVILLALGLFVTGINKLFNMNKEDYIKES